MYHYAGRLVVYLLLVAATNATPLRWTRSRAPEPEPTSTTLVHWQGLAKTSGAFIFSRVNVDYINSTCTKFIQTLVTAREVILVLEKTKLAGSLPNQQKRYGYSLLRLETELRDTLYYLHNLVLCSGRGGELWSNFIKFRDQASAVWTILRNYGVTQAAHFPERVPPALMSQREPTNDQSGENMIELMHASRPQFDMERQPKALFLVGAGVGLLGGLVATKLFGNDNSAEIAKLNENLGKNSKLLKITNNRIDMLHKNISRSNEIIKTILDKMVETNQKKDLHFAVQWNLDQIISINTEIINVFKLAELTLTLLDNGILNPDLLKIDSLKKIINEGLTLFPSLSFPLDVTRFNIHNIVKLLRVHRVGRMQFLIVIPLTEQTNYEIVTVIPHPMKLSDHALAIPQTRQTLLTNTDQTYIITEKSNIESISATQHILVEVQPIFRQTFMSCEWAVFKNIPEEIVKLCDFKLAGAINDTYVIETEKNRIIYFNQETEVNLDCPEQKINTKLIGLHNISLACDITTNSVHWPSKQTAIINIYSNSTEPMHMEELPIANIDETSDVHDSLKEMINRLPKKNQSYTFDFDYYELSMEQLHTFTICSQSVLTIVVIINSILLGFLFYRRRNKEETHTSHSEFSLGNAFRHLRDSLRHKPQFIRNSFRNLRRSFRSRDSTREGKLNDRKSNSPEHHTEDGRADDHLDAGTDDEATTEPPIYTPKAYPPIPRYKI